MIKVTELIGRAKKINKLCLGIVIVAVCTLPGMGQKRTPVAQVDDLSVAIDTIRLDTVSSKPDSVMLSVKSKLDSLSVGMNSKIDSLTNLNLPPEQYTKQVDSLYRSLGSSISALKGKYDAPEARRELARADSIVVRKTQFLDSLLTANDFSGVGGMSSKLKLPDHLSSKSLTLPSLSGGSLPSANSNIHAGSLPDLSSNGIPADLVSIPKEGIDELNSASGVTRQAGQYGDQAGKMSEHAKELNTPEVRDKLANEAEQRISKIDEVESVNKESQAATAAIKNQADGVKATVKDPTILKEQANAKIADFLAGKEEVVKKDLEDIGKTQLKYRNIADSRFLPKRPPNEMKGKPFVERLIPGISLQMLNTDNILVDVAPFLGYRFSGRISATVSGYRRIVYVKKDDALRTLDCYGFRIYNNVKVIGSISTHLEMERFKIDYAYLNFKPVTNDDHRWKSKVNFGAFHRYSLGKNFHGHFIIMYDILQIRKFPNTTGAAARFGFDYQLKKRSENH